VSGARPSARVVRRRRLVVATLVVLVLLTGAWMVTRSPLLDVDRVEVRGTTQVTPDAVQAAAGVHPGDPMVWLDAGDVAGRVETLPWVRHASVQREWPDTVRITVRERAPVAWVAAGDGAFLVVDRTGRGLAVDSTQPAGLPQLLDVTPAPVGAAITPVGGAWLAGHLRADELALVASITVRDARATLQVTSGQEVRFGRLSQVGDKMRAAVAVLGQPGIGERTYIDVSAPSTPVAG